MLEGRPHIVDMMKNGEIAMVFNTTDGAKALADSKDIRRTALLNHIPYYTTLAGAIAVTKAIKAMKAKTLNVAPLQRYARPCGLTVAWPGRGPSSAAGHILRNARRGAADLISIRAGRRSATLQGLPMQRIDQCRAMRSAGGRSRLAHERHLTDAAVERRSRAYPCMTLPPRAKQSSPQCRSYAMSKLSWRAVWNACR